MSRIVNHETAGKERRQMVRLILFAIRELNSQKEISSETRDLAAFIAITLITIHDSIDRSVEPWEKRGYWIKADRYRMEWAWTLQLGNQIKEGVINEDWHHVANLVATVAEKFGEVKLPRDNSNGKFWEGAMKILEQR
jgi:hypothetical protein